MKRLKYSLSGFLRSLQISRYTVFAFVEGKDLDPYFYGKICHEVCFDHGENHKIKTAEELPWHGGGKASLILFYKYLQSKKKLVTHFKGKRTIIFFFLDKDIDDILKTRCRSLHVVYTKYYDIYNHIFLFGNILDAIAATASIDVYEISQLSIFKNDWCMNAAQRWKKWVELCLFAKLNNVNVSNYHHASKINKPLNGNVDDEEYKKCKELMRTSLGWTQEKLEKEIIIIQSRVNKYFTSGKQDIVFKGKWYPQILELDLKNAFDEQSCNLKGFNKRIASVLITSIDFSDSWSKNLRDTIAEVLENTN